MTYQLEWGDTPKGKTKQGDDIIMMSKNGNVRIVYSVFAVQGKYRIERKTVDGYWDRFSTAQYSSDFLGEVKRCAKYILDEPMMV